MPWKLSIDLKLGFNLSIISWIFKSDNPQKRAEAIVKATTYYNDPKVIAEVSEGLGEAMSGIDVRQLPEHEQYAKRGW